MKINKQQYGNSTQNRNSTQNGPIIEKILLPGTAVDSCGQKEQQNPNYNRKDTQDLYYFVPDKDDATLMVATPMVATPMVNKPMVAKPMVNKPMVNKPLVNKPMVAKPMVATPIVASPVPLRSQKDAINSCLVPIVDVATPIVAPPINATPTNAHPPNATPFVSLSKDKVKTPKPIEQNFECSKCDSLFENVASLTQHFALAHQIKEVQEYKPHLERVHEGNKPKKTEENYIMNI